MSSARERRRRNKQEGGGRGRGRVVLKSRSAIDLCKKEDKKREEIDFISPPVVSREISESNSDLSSRMERGSDPDKNEGEQLQPSSNQSNLRVPSDKERDVDEPDSGLQPPLDNERSSQEVEVEEFFTLLDTTLHLPDSPPCPAPFENGDHPGPPLTAFSTSDHPVFREVKAERERPLPPGRLADRIKELREYVSCTMHVDGKDLGLSLQHFACIDGHTNML